MGEPKMYASLSSGLLARKGAAKPAMRPQGFNAFGGNLEDLGWNDMGSTEPATHAPSSITALTPSPRGGEVPHPAAPPVVVEQQRQIAESFAPEPAPAPLVIEAPEAELEEEPVVAPVAMLPTRRATPKKQALPSGRKAAFTLRLDEDRHTRLRLASAVLRRSSQALVTDALDSWFASHPELDSLAAHLPSGLQRN